MTDLTPPPALILAGGRSSRMGSNKALLTLGGDTLLGHVLRRLAPQTSEIVLNAPDGLAGYAHLPRIDDDRPGQAGPLAGILAGLKHLRRKRAVSPASDRLLSVPCDSPFVPLDLAARLASTGAESQGDATIAVACSDGRMHPVFALWPVAIADDLSQWLADPENRRIKAFLARHRVVTVDFPLAETATGSLDPFLNINTPEDLGMAERFAGVLA